jgi:predicted TPR repeat methyltransferase
MNRNQRRLAKKKQDDFEVLFNLASIRNRQGKIDEAIDCYNQALAVRPDSPTARNNLGLLLKSVGKLPEAVASFRHVLSLNPQLAEAHYNLAATLRSQGLTAEAISHYRQAIELKPDYVHGRINLGMCLAENGQLAEALDQAEVISYFTRQAGFPHFRFAMLLVRCNCIEVARTCFEAYLAQDPNDSEGARLVMAGLGLAPMPERASSTQLERIYAYRAVSWDDGATGPLAYRGAELVAQTLERLIGATTELDILDGGCGTGVVGARLSGRARLLEGVDVSAPMLARAKAKGVYHRLHQDDLVAFLHKCEASFDVVTCAATLIHFGDLRPAFEAAATGLRDGGLLVATLFPNERDEDAVGAGALDGLGEGGCFTHGRRYVARMAQAAGFSVAAMEAQVHEFTRAHQRIGLVVALRRNSRASASAAPVQAA